MTVQTLLPLHGDRTELTKRFEAYDAANPQVYELFKRFTFEAIRRGKKRLGGFYIVNRIRWEIDMTTTGDDFKINNDFCALLVRKFQREHPQHADVFRTKETKRF